MTVVLDQVVVRLTPAQTLRMERMGRTLWADGEIKRSRGHPASGSDAVVVGGERAQHGGAGAVEIHSWRSEAARIVYMEGGMARAGRNPIVTEDDMVY
jgi:hypothetical protein